jgi:hypothetical protein
MRSFETWNYEEVEDTFGISPLRTGPHFEQNDPLGQFLSSLFIVVG